MRFGDAFYRIGVYYTHYQCLGHTARINTLLKNFRKKLSNSDFYLFQGSLPQTYLKLPDYVKIFNLPYPLFSKDSFKQPLRVNNHFSQLRSAYILELIKKYGLDIFLTEYFPLGRNICKDELLPILYFLKKNNKIIVSSAGYPVISEKSTEDINFFSKFYNKIYIH
ncbi:MAG: hypothetical protein K9L76_02280, partial [Candidatus Omnitrophica bacterium]|nr:hypothetical protein [Candidatus Omnitrophota bacterium]